MKFHHKIFMVYGTVYQEMLQILTDFTDLPATVKPKPMKIGNKVYRVVVIPTSYIKLKTTKISSVGSGGFVMKLCTR